MNTSCGEKDWYANEGVCPCFWYTPFGPHRSLMFRRAHSWEIRVSSINCACPLAWKTPKWGMDSKRDVCLLELYPSLNLPTVFSIFLLLRSDKPNPPLTWQFVWIVRDVGVWEPQLVYKLNKGKYGELEWACAHMWSPRELLAPTVCLSHRHSPPKMGWRGEMECLCSWKSSPLWFLGSLCDWLANSLAWAVKWSRYHAMWSPRGPLECGSKNIFSVFVYREWANGWRHWGGWERGGGLAWPGCRKLKTICATPFWAKV